MAYQLEKGQGSLFKNPYKDADRKPDYTGRINIDGVIYTVAAWVKKTQRGDAYLSMQARLPVENEAPAAAPAPRAAAPAPASKAAPAAPAEPKKDVDDLPF